MSHIQSISAAMFTDLSVSNQAANTHKTLADLPDSDATALAGLFGTAGGVEGTDFTRFRNVKEFPAIGTPANIVKVPVYGQKTSKQVNGQADLNNMELTVNFIPGNWADNKLNGSNVIVGDNTVRLFRFMLSADAITNFKNGSLAVENSAYYFLGKVEAIEVTPSLTDAMTAKVTISVQSEIRGAYTTA